MRIARGLAVITLTTSLTFVLAVQRLVAEDAPSAKPAAANPAAPAPAPTATLAEIERWIAELGHPQFTVREQATVALGKAGGLAIPHLLSATREKQLEIGVRAVRALKMIYESATDDSFDAAEVALEAIHDSKNAALVRRADQALSMRDQDRQRRAIVRLEQLGAEIRILKSASQRTVNNVIEIDDGNPYIEQLLLGDDWKGGDAGLKFVRRIARVGAIYITPGSKISQEGVAGLQADFPETMIQQRGSAMLGISCEPIEGGLLVSRVQGGSGASQAGLEINDVILKFEGNEVRDFQVVIDTTKNRKVGDKLTLEIERNGTPMTKVITLGKWSVKDSPNVTPTRPAPVPKLR